MESPVGLEDIEQTSSEKLIDVYKNAAAYPIDFLKSPTDEINQAAEKLEIDSYDPKIERIAETIDKANVIGLVEGNNTSTFGLCDTSSQAVRRLAQLQGMTAENYQVRSLQRASGVDDKHDAFIHLVTVIKNADSRYLVDLTYPQFVRVNKKDIGDDFSVLTKKIEDPDIFPMVNQLFRKGYFRLTDENLRTYLYITSQIPKSEWETIAPVVNTSIIEKIEPTLSSINPELLDEYIGVGK